MLFRPAAPRQLILEPVDFLVTLRLLRLETAILFPKAVALVAERCHFVLNLLVLGLEGIERRLLVFVGRAGRVGGWLVAFGVRLRRGFSAGPG